MTVAFHPAARRRRRGDCATTRAFGNAFRPPCGWRRGTWAPVRRHRCPTLSNRGADSDLLTEGTHRKMGERGPRAQLAEVAGVGHAPMFMDEAQVALARDFLLED